MKRIILALRVFKKHWIFNILMMAELAVVTVAAVVTANMAHAGAACIETFQNSPDRILYCANPFYMSDAGSGNAKKVDKESSEKLSAVLGGIRKDIPSYRGASELCTSLIIFDRNKLVNHGNHVWKPTQGAEVVTADDETARAVHYPLAAGKWFSASKIDGCAPCVIGGTQSWKYPIGAKITGYTFDGTGKSGLFSGSVRKIVFMVTGRLAKPEQILNTNYGGSKLSASNIIEGKSDSTLLILASASAAGPMVSLSGSQNVNRLIYLDRSATASEIESVRTRLTKDYTIPDRELIANEKNSLSQNLSILLPFILLLFLVSLCGVVSMCMLTTLRNMDTFRIYYLTGCPRGTAVAVMGIHSLLYFIGAGLLFFPAMRWLYTRPNEMMIKAYFILYPQTLAMIGAAVLAVCLFSFILPFWILRRRKPADLLRSN